MDATPQQPQPEDDWLVTPTGEPVVEPAGVAPAYGEPAPAKERKGVLTGVGLVAAGLVAGAIGSFALGHHGDGTTTIRNAGNQQAFGNLQGGPGGGGFDGEQRLQGTLTAIGSSSVTVRTDSGTETYTVTSSSELVRNGQQVSLSGLKTGEAVFLHVYPQNGTTVVERLFAGTLPQGGPGGFPGGTQQGTQPSGVING